MATETHYMTVKEMAAAVGLSRDRFYDYMRDGIFPGPVYLVRNRRPCYPVDLQQVAIEVRSSGIGVNGQAVIFSQTRRSRSLRPFPRRQDAGTPRVDQLLRKMRIFGFKGITREQLIEAMRICVSSGVNADDQTSLLRAMARWFMRESVGH